MDQPIQDPLLYKNSNNGPGQPRIHTVVYGIADGSVVVLVEI